MEVKVEASLEADGVRLIPIGPFDLGHAEPAATAVEDAEARLNGSAKVDLDLTRIVRLDGAGAVLLARLLDRLSDAGLRTRVLSDANPEAGRLIELYRASRDVRCRVDCCTVSRPRAWHSRRASGESREPLTSGRPPADVASRN